MVLRQLLPQLWPLCAFTVDYLLQLWRLVLAVTAQLLLQLWPLCAGSGRQQLLHAITATFFPQPWLLFTGSGGHQLRARGVSITLMLWQCFAAVLRPGTTPSMALIPTACLIDQLWVTCPAVEPRHDLHPA